MTDEPRPTPRIAFVCVQNAGRSQMATAFAERERAARGSDVEILTGGTDPADEVHEEVVSAMAEIDIDIDIAEREPREITFEELQQCQYVITMGCSASDVCPATWSGENRDWNLDDPDGKTPDEVCEIREEIRWHVRNLFDEIESERRNESSPNTGTK